MQHSLNDERNKQKWLLWHWHRIFWHLLLLSLSQLLSDFNFINHITITWHAQVALTIQSTIICLAIFCQLILNSYFTDQSNFTENLYRKRKKHAVLWRLIRLNSRAEREREVVIPFFKYLRLICWLYVVRESRKLSHFNLYHDLILNLSSILKELDSKS